MENAKIISHPAKQMTDLQKKHVALQVINKKAPVTEIAKSHNVSRQFVYSQKDKAMAAVDQAFNKKDNDDEKILFHLPVTKSWIDQLVLCLMLHGRTSFRDITKVVKDVLDLDISVGRIRNIAKNAKQLAISINAQQDLSAVKLAAYDELFHHDKPVLAGVDIPSLYCYLLSQEDERDGDTWAIHFLDIQQQGFNPDRVIGDGGRGLRSAHEMIFPEIPFDYENFHLTKLLVETRRFFTNIYRRSLLWLFTMERKMEKAKERGYPRRHSRKLGDARKPSGPHSWPMASPPNS